MALSILVTNDDGIYAPGINCLYEALMKKYQAVMFAPDRDHSGASSALTLNAPIRLHTLEDGRNSVQGTPTDCVHLALTGLLDELPDMVVSGINRGANMGDDVWYSGTVAAAMEGRYLGFPSLALSLAGGSNPRHYDTAAAVALDILLQIQGAAFDETVVLNVNIPDVPLADIAGYEVTRLGVRHKAEPTICRKDPRGRDIYWIGPAGSEADSGPGTDFYAVKHNRVSITPLQVDLTQKSMLHHLKQLFSSPTRG